MSGAPDWIRYERGELGPDDAARVERELAASAEGRARLALLRLLRASAVSPAGFERAADAPCPDAHELAELAEGRLAEEPARLLRRHLAGCGHCLLLVEAALDEVAAAEAERAEARARERRDAFSVLASKPARYAAAAAVLVATALLLLQGPSWRGTELAEVARVEVLPVRIPRGADDGEAERLLREGLQDYDAGRFAAAAERLRASFDAAPSGEAGLYLGSALLHEGRAPDAIDALRGALPHAGEELAPEVLWQLAQAALLIHDGRWARELLLELEGSRSRHAAAARELLAELDRRRR